MKASEETTANRVLLALADLAPSAEQRSSTLAVPTEWFRWLPLRAVRVLLAAGGSSESPYLLQTVSVDRKFGEKLAAVDRIRPAQRSLRVGWLFVAGRMPMGDGRSRRVFHPLVTVPVRVDRLGGTMLAAAGDVELSPLVADWSSRRDLDSGIELGGGALDDIGDVAAPDWLLGRLPRLQHFARAVAAAADLPATKVVPAQQGPDELCRHDGLVIVAGVGVYATYETGGASRASSLRTWASEPLRAATAFHRLYLADEAEPATRSDPTPPHAAVPGSPFLLTPVQRQAVQRSRSDPVTLISGAPGTGKSHTLAAIACDALARGETVLVAAKSDATVDALLDLLERSPGPDPVVFGSNERREALAALLSAGQLQPEFQGTIDGLAASLARAVAQRDGLRTTVVELLRAEALLATPEDEFDEGRREAAGLFDPDVDLEQAEQLLGGATSTPTWWWGRRRRRKAERQLRRLADATAGVSLDDLARFVTDARSAKVVAGVTAAGGLDIGDRWAQLRSAEDRARDALGVWIAAESRSARHLNRSTLGAVAALATALRSGRSARREQLRRLNEAKLTSALPLWVGTLADVDDLLPAVPGLFDLVILDEASSIDQVLAAPAMLRGARTVVAGDPHQLRHVSFLADDQLWSALAAHQLDEATDIAALLDVRRNSLFDVAAGAAPVLVLDEQFRSDPHLVEFVARRLYGGRVHIANRSPATACKDCVDLIRLEGRRDDGGVVRVEVERVIEELRALLVRRQSSVGVVTPFRAQADAIEEAVLATFHVDELEALDLRVGTVHAFQGNERDVVIASLGLGPSDSSSSWRFVEDPHLFAVFATRARKRMLFLYSADPPEGGLLHAYLAQANSPPGPPKPAGRVSDWAEAIGRDLESSGLVITCAYPSGRHVVDVCIEDPTRCVAIECDVHRDGPEAHIERHLDLVRRGWDILEAPRSRWAERRGELIVRLITDLDRT